MIPGPPTSTMTETIEIRCDRCGRERETKPTAKGEPRPPGGTERPMDTKTHTPPPNDRSESDE